MKYFDNQVVVITGANGGLGSEMVKQLSETKAQLILSDIADRSAHHNKNILAYIKSDLGSKEGCEALVSECFKVSENIDMVINNAGVATVGEFIEIPDEKWEAQININLLAPMRLVKLFLPKMIEQKRGHIVNISSVGGFIALPKNASYAASKFGLRGFGTSLHGEVARHNVHVSNVYPSFTKTAILDSERFGYERSKQLPDFLVDQPDYIVSKALQGVAKKQLHIFPSSKARTFAAMARIFPDSMAMMSNQLLKFAD